MGNHTSKMILHGKKKQDDSVSEPTYGSRRSSVSEYSIKRSQSLVSMRKKEEDAKEADRHQREHYMLKIIRKGNTSTVLNSPSVIVESGIGGNGIWALEMATQYPKTKVIGLDLRLPDVYLLNQTFHCVNVLKPWPIDEGSADFVFQKSMGQRIEKDQWPAVLKEMFKVLKRGGNVELVEPEILNHRGGPALTQLQKLYGDQCRLYNLDLDLANMTNMLSDAGFEQVSQRSFDIPVGEWPEETELKHFGFMNLEIRKAHAKNRKSEFMASWGMSSSAYDSLITESARETEEYRTFTRYNCWIARKPF